MGSPRTLTVATNPVPPCETWTNPLRPLRPMPTMGNVPWTIDGAGGGAGCATRAGPLGAAGTVLGTGVVAGAGGMDTAVGEAGSAGSRALDVVAGEAQALSSSVNKAAGTNRFTPDNYPRRLR